MALILKFKPRPKKPSQAQEAYYEHNGLRYLLCLIHPEEMDAIIKQNGKYYGIPSYWDREGRTYPIGHNKVTYN